MNANHVDWCKCRKALNKNAGPPERANKQILLIQAAGVVRDEAVNKAWSLRREVDEKQIGRTTSWS